MSIVSRRDVLRIGGMSAFGLSLPDYFRLCANASDKPKAKAKSVIFLHQFGGPSQFETFDMKPDAPAEIRGTFKPINSKLPGLPVCEMLPRIAKITDKLCVIRSVQHHMKNHNSATYYSLTGFAPAVDDIRLRDSLELFPAYGSVADKFVGGKKAGVPGFVSFPHTISDGSITPGQHASFLGKTHNPFFVGQDPNGANFRLPELSLPDSITPERLENRREALKLIDSQTDLLEKSAVAQGIDEAYQKAVSMLASKELKDAFDISQEKKETRDRYGRTTYGQSCLLARRLVEVGVKFVTVYCSQSIGGDYGWDTHGFGDKPMDPILKKTLLPTLDLTLSALIEDLDTRGLLDDTLVLWMGEFGRTPRINKLAGRDHWPQCYTVVMAGGGAKRGAVVGSSDKIGAYPASGLVRLEDISATFYHLLGIDPETEIRDKLDRPFPISRGKPVADAIS
jgi:hypothetical protein